MPAEQGMHQGVLGLSKKEKSARADERKPPGHKNLPHLSPKPSLLFSTESEDSAVFFDPVFSSRFLQLHRRVREMAGILEFKRIFTAYACWFLFPRYSEHCLLPSASQPLQQV